MLEARDIPATSGQLYADVEGDIEEVDGKVVITRIRVRYHLKDVPEEKREVVERALSMHGDHCPAALSVKRGIAIECSCEFE
ncbi:MAG: OsmC family protein [Nitrospirota bacterium]|nr:OsmC family protein [Nitrospirota bacterium]